MDFLHRLHIRRPSSPRKRPSLIITSEPLPPPPPSRPSSALSPSYTSAYDPSNISRSLDICPLRHYTPAPPPSPRGRSEHHRTPSLLRNLAHHPSLSALKGKSRRKKGSQSPVKGEHLGRIPDELDVQERTQTQSQTQGRRSRLRKGSLKESRSVPRNLRFSGDHSAFRPSEDIPPIPSSLASSLLSERTQSHDAQHVSPATSTPPRNRLPTITPDIAIDYADASPGSLRVRMRLDLRMGSPGRRGRSEDWSPGRGQGSLIPKGRLSSPAPPHRLSMGRPSPPRLSLPVTTQHPHPVPLNTYHRSRSRTPYPNQSHILACSEDDFSPHDANDDESQEAANDDDPSDGLDLLVPQEQIPIGTPGGSKADLRRGAFVDGKRHEKGAIRFFSRDTYGAQRGDLMQSSADWSEQFDTLENTSSHSQSFSRQSRRSSSPFEVKLSPLVAKRISLDAFGTPSPEESNQGDHRAVEELVDEDIPSMEDSYEDSYPLSGFQGAQLSTIRELPSSHGSTNTNPAERSTETPAQLGCIGDRTKFFTPSSSPSKFPQVPDLPLPGSEVSPWRRVGRHMSAPPLDSTQSLLDARVEHTRALQAEVRAGQTIIDVLRAEIESLREAVGRDNDEKDRQDMAELRRECEMKEEALVQLRTAMGENEEFFEKLQEAHDNLAVRCVELEEQNANLRIEGEETSSKLSASLIMHEEDVSSRRQLEGAKRKLEEALEAAEEEARRLRHDKTLLEEQLETMTEENIMALTTHDGDLQESRQRVTERDGTIAQLRAELHEVSIKHQTEIKAMETGHKALQRELVNKDGTISQLRDKLQTARFEYDEAKCLVQREIMELQRELDGERERGREKDEISREMQSAIADLERKRQALMAERDEIRDTLERARNDFENSEQVHDEVAELSDQFEMAANHLSTLQDALEDADNRLATQLSTLALQGVELEELRQSLNDAEDALANALESSSHASKDSERTILRLRQEISDLQSELGSHRAALKDAVTSRELEKSTSSDVRSRLDAYLAEIDRLKVVEARLLKQVEDLKRESAMDEVKRVELQRRVEKLEEDKELLNVALESKQTELILLQRQAGPAATRPSSVTPRKQRLGDSTTRVPQTPNAFSTPVREAKHLTTSTAVSATKARRESSVVGPSSIARPTPASSPRTVLGASSRHNRTPERARAGTGVSNLGGGAGEGVARKTVQGTTVGGIKRQSSLPVLKSRMVSGTSAGFSRKVTSLAEEEGEL